LLKHDVLDHQLINVEGTRLVRTDEVELARVGSGDPLLVGVQVVNGLLLPINHFFIWRLARSEESMGADRNAGVGDWLTAVTVFGTSALSLILVAVTVFGF
jgi:Mn2+/Fe2+ NRAMP family transporter